MNLQLVIEMLRLIGYVVITLVLDLDKHGIPARRCRRWIIGCLAPGCTVSHQAYLQKAASEIEEAVRQQPLPLAAFLDDGDEDNRAMAQQPCKRGTKRKRSQAPKKPRSEKKPCKARKPSNPNKDIELHDKVWDGRRPAEVPQVLSDISRELSPRELDVTLFDHVVRAEGLSEHEVRLLDVSQSIHRTPTGTTMAPTVTPGGRIVAVPHTEDAPARLVRGLECFGLQGLDTNMFTEAQRSVVHGFPQKQLMSLAGNAYSGPHVSMVMLLCLSLFDFPTSVAQLEGSRKEATHYIYMFKSEVGLDIQMLLL